MVCWVLVVLGVGFCVGISRIVFVGGWFLFSSCVCWLVFFRSILIVISGCVFLNLCWFGACFRVCVVVLICVVVFWGVVVVVVVVVVLPVLFLVFFCVTLCCTFEGILL